MTYLEAHGVQTRVCFSGNITKHPAFAEFAAPFANADAIMARAESLILDGACPSAQLMPVSAMSLALAVTDHAFTSSEPNGMPSNEKGLPGGRP